MAEAALLEESVSAAVSSGVKVQTQSQAAEPSNSRPFDFSATKETLTLSWIAFTFIALISCVAGALCGYCTRKSSGANAYQHISANAHDVE